MDNETVTDSATLRILHLSDTHLTGDGALHNGTVNTLDHLRRALAMVQPRPVDLIVCSGDVSEDGSIASYEIARDVLEEFAAGQAARAAEAPGAHTAPTADAPAIPVVFAMGNHDLLDPFEQVLGPAQRIVHVAGWRIIVLNTAVPGAGYGALGSEQLDFLRSALAAEAQRAEGADGAADPKPDGPAARLPRQGSIIVMHHAPIGAQTDLLQALNLDEQDASDLETILAGSDVRAVLSGHYHQAITELVWGVPVIVTPGVANLSWPVDDPAEEAAVIGWGGTVITLTAAGERQQVRVRAVPFTGTPNEQEAFRFTGEQVQQIASAAGRPDPRTE